MAFEQNFEHWEDQAFQVIRFEIYDCKEEDEGKRVTNRPTAGKNLSVGKRRLGLGSSKET